MLQTWAYNSRHVQEEISGDDFLAAQSTLIAAGPPRLSQTGLLPDLDQPVFPTAGGANGVAGTSSIRSDRSSVFAWPMGLVESLSLGQNRQTTTLFEIGSRSKYFINGRTVGSISLARTMYDGPNLLRALYAYYPRSKMPNGAAQRSVASLLALPADKFRQLTRVAGYADFFINLDSDLFDKPFGLFCLMVSASEDAFGAFYIEGALVTNTQFGVSSQANIIGEGATIVYDQVIPVSIGAKNFADKLAESRSNN